MVIIYLEYLAQQQQRQRVLRLLRVLVLDGGRAQDGRALHPRQATEGGKGE